MDYKQLEEENKKLKEQIEYIKTYKKNYFQDIQKHKFRFCSLCNKDVRYSSYSNHIKSTKHIKNKNDFIKKNENLNIK
jgi:hypothetical protein